LYCQSGNIPLLFDSRVRQLYRLFEQQEVSSVPH
jgi:hypothetical protein